MSPRQISAMHADVIRSHHHMVALDTHSRFISAAAGFGGDKAGNLTKFVTALTEEDAPGGEKKQVSLADIVAMGRAVAAEQAAEDDFTRAEREAEEALALNLFAKHRAKPRPK